LSGGASVADEYGIGEVGKGGESGISTRPHPSSGWLSLGSCWEAGCIALSGDDSVDRGRLCGTRYPGAIGETERRLISTTRLIFPVSYSASERQPLPIASEGDNEEIEE